MREYEEGRRGCWNDNKGMQLIDARPGQTSVKGQRLPLGHDDVTIHPDNYKWGCTTIAWLRR